MEPEAIEALSIDPVVLNTPQEKYGMIFQRSCNF